ncbi:aldehyde dehydrogenase (NADP(+)) [Granulicoccus sp. GXG6511]|uniref:aldehyde dehydrogenase (NADP(+)) n=1 Tax=Granulicoccus sp. GXG6511 TaxID=3381351 RepID=UPI003D7D982B
MAGNLNGSMFVAGTAVAGAGEVFRAVDPATGTELEPAYAAASAAQLAEAAEAARIAFPAFRRTAPEVRADLLRAIADGLDAEPDLVDRVRAETGILPERVAAERTRTSNQLRLFADVVTEGSYLGLRIDRGNPARVPLPKPDLRHRFIPLGPVAVFGASNFPLAFSVAGGDTAAALAAGCPVVVKAHEAHPGTSEIVGRIITDAVAGLGLPPGTFSLIAGHTPELAVALVTHPAIQAVGFTGSRRAGLALTAAAQRRPVPIPVFAEMASINPVLVLPGALSERGPEIGRGLIGSVLTGFGQLCTSPGLVFVPDLPDADALVEAAATAVESSGSGCMLTPRIAESFAAGVARLESVPGVRRLARAATEDDISALCTPTLFDTDLETFLEHHEELTGEVFGSVTLLVRVPGDLTEAVRNHVLPLLEGQLTATIHAEPDDHDAAAGLLDELELLAGRIVFNGWSTGLEVNDAVIHGGPFPATSAPATTSVGTRAIERFLRPVAYQNVPPALLPRELQDDTRGIWRRVDGRFTA